MRSDEMSLMYPSSTDNARFTMVPTAGGGYIERVIRFLAGNYPDLPTSAVKRTRVGLANPLKTESLHESVVCLVPRADGLFDEKNNRRRTRVSAPVFRGGSFYCLCPVDRDPRSGGHRARNRLHCIASFMYKTKP